MDSKQIINSGEENKKTLPENKIWETVATNSAPAPVPSVKDALPADNDSVMVSKKLLEGMLADIKRLKDGGVDRPARVQEDRAYVRLIDGKIVSKIGRMWTEQKNTPLNPEEENRLFGELVTEDNTSHKVDFVHFLDNSERLFGFIKKIEKKDVSRNLGEAEIEQQDPHGDRERKRNFEPYKIEVVEARTDNSYILEIAEGKRAGEKIEVHNSVLNL